MRGVNWLVLCCISAAAFSEEVFLIDVRAADPLLTPKAKDQVVVIGIDNGKDDELIIAVRYGGIYEWSAELRIGPRIVPLKPTPDLLYSGTRMKLGDAFTKEDAKLMTLVITSGIFK
jgi:hypothetical protein